MMEVFVDCLSEHFNYLRVADYGRDNGSKHYMELALKQWIRQIDVLDEFPTSFFSGIYYIQIFNTNWHTLLFMLSSLEFSDSASSE